MKTELQLGIFKGFYGSHLEADIDEAVNQDLQDLNVEYNDVNIKYDLNSLAIDLFNYAKGEYLDLDFLSNVQFSELVSPKFYNYSNDKIYFKCDIDKTEFIKWANDLLTNNDDISEMIIGNIVDTHTSGSGFSSFHSNKISDWITDLNTFDLEDSKTAYKIGFIISAFTEANEQFEDMDWNFELNYINDGNCGVYNAYEIEQLETI